MPTKKTPKKTPTKIKAKTKSKPSTAQLHAETALTQEVKELTKQVQRLRDTELLEIYKKPGRFMLYALVKGLMIGFGSVVGASLLVGIFVYLISQVQLVPVLGDFVQEVLQEIDVNNVISSEQTEAPATTSE